MIRKLYTLLFFTLILLGVVILYEGITRVTKFTIPNEQYGLLSLRFVDGTLLFGPDVMLGRAVETLMDEEGSVVPFEHIRNTVSRHDITIANFEASVPEKHVPTPSFGMQFSVKEEYLDTLREAGFDVLSLANNHALDFGESGYTNTIQSCEKVKLHCIGHPSMVSTSSVLIKRLGDTTVSVLMLNTLFGEPSTTTLASLTSKMIEESDIQYAFIHWGDEYEPVHNTKQQELAYFLIDNGIDGIVGHHPHVMQDIEEYKGKPIFYSLGNLIFDQFWNSTVQEGYLVSVTFTKKHITYEIVPFDTLEKRSVPKLKEGDERTRAFLEILPVKYFTHDERLNGRIQYDR
jgi:gamma-polyglutamate biosynthesis protein CapA